MRIPQLTHLIYILYLVLGTTMHHITIKLPPSRHLHQHICGNALYPCDIQPTSHVYSFPHLSILSHDGSYHLQCQSALAPSRKQRLQIEDLRRALSRSADAKKLARMEELLFMQEDIKRARKEFNDEEMGGGGVDF